MAGEAEKKAIARQVLNGSSERVTNQRTLLLDLIHQSNGHLDADELYRLAREKQGRISLSTVYRNLQLFKRLGLVEERHFDEGHHHYEVKPAADHQHLRCVNCGKVVEFACPVSQKLKKEMSRKYDFEITRVEVSMAGICSDCRRGKK